MRALKVMIRHFVDDDLVAVRNLICETIDFSYPGAYSATAITFFKNYHRKSSILEDSRNGLTFVIENDNKIVATGTLLGDEIKRMFVSPHMQGYGLGKYLMDRLLQRAREKGLEKVFLDSSTVSNGFYMKLGFHPVSESFILLDDGCHLDYTKMILVLKEPGD